MPRKKSTKTKQREEREIRAEVKRLNLVLISLRIKAHAQREANRSQLHSIARDLAPHAAALARRGKPRLLATLARINGDDHLTPPSLEPLLENFEKHVREEENAKRKKTIPVVPAAKDPTLP